MSIYWITRDRLHLAIVARPRGGDWLADDIALLRRNGIDVLVSALTESEIDELGLADEAECCRNAGIEFLSFQIEDRGVPNDTEAFKNFIEVLVDLVKKGRAIGVHCRAGIGRSSLIVASVAIRIGEPIDSAFAVVAEARGRPVPDTPEQRLWVESYWRSVAKN